MRRDSFGTNGEGVQFRFVGEKSKAAQETKIMFSSQERAMEVKAVVRQ
jgi:hypothetical protein